MWIKSISLERNLHCESFDVCNSIPQNTQMDKYEYSIY